jgi:hypothetical protein
MPGIGWTCAGKTGFETGPLADQSGGRDSFGPGVVVQPARNKISAPDKMIPAIFNTRQLCGTRKRTQAVSFIYDL